MIDADHVRWISKAYGLEVPEDDLVPVASALTDLMKGVRSFDELEFPADGSEAHFDVDWHLRAG
jgi:hypothetical protein